ncbi:hypothetical protein Bpfe_001494, partial [Biomphalaria pfeifferi]
MTGMRGVPSVFRSQTNWWRHPEVDMVSVGSLISLTHSALSGGFLSQGPFIISSHESVAGWANLSGREYTEGFTMSVG